MEIENCFINSTNGRTGGLPDCRTAGSSVNPLNKIILKNSDSKLKRLTSPDRKEKKIQKEKKNITGQYRINPELYPNLVRQL